MKPALIALVLLSVSNLFGRDSSSSAQPIYDTDPSDTNAVASEDPIHAEELKKTRITAKLLSLSAIHLDHIFPFPADGNEATKKYFLEASHLFEPKLRDQLLSFGNKLASNEDERRDLQGDRILNRKWGVDFQNVGANLVDWDSLVIQIKEVLKDGKIWTGYVGYTELHFEQAGDSYLISDIVTKRSYQAGPLEKWSLKYEMKSLQRTQKETKIDPSKSIDKSPAFRGP